MGEADTSLPSGIFPEHVEMVKMRAITRPIPRFYYEHPDGRIIDCTEQQAALLEKDLNKKHFRRYGYSDGTAYVEYLKNCGVKVGQEIPYAQAREIMLAAGEVEKAKAKGNFRVPVIQEWQYDGSVPLQDRLDRRQLIDPNERFGDKLG